MYIFSKRYNCAPLLPWKSNYDNYFLQTQQNEQSQHHEQCQYEQYDNYEQQLNAQFQEEYDNTPEFHDPWEDYYKKQEEMIMQQQQNFQHEQHHEHEQHYSQSEEEHNQSISCPNNANEDQHSCASESINPQDYEANSNECYVISHSTTSTTDQYNDNGDYGVQSIVSVAPSTCTNFSNKTENPANSHETDLANCSSMVSARDTSQLESCTVSQACCPQEHNDNEHSNKDDADDNDDKEVTH